MDTTTTMVKREEIEAEDLEDDDEQDDSVIGDFAELVAGYRHIKGRLCLKSDPRQFKRQDQDEESYYFTFALEDESGNSLRGVAFGKDYERLYPVLRRNRRYILRDVNVRPADRQYSSDNLELRITRDSRVEELLERKNLKFIPLDRLTIGSRVDLIGVLREVDRIDSVYTRDGREVSRRRVIIVDQSCSSMMLTVWGHQAVNFEGAPGDVIITRGAHIVSFWNKSASATDTVFINTPHVPQVEHLKTWYRIRGNDLTFTPLSSSENQPVEQLSPPRTDSNLNMELG